MKKKLCLLLSAALVLGLAACTSTAGKESETPTEESQTVETPTVNEPVSTSGKILVAVISRSGENWNVGEVDPESSYAEMNWPVGTIEVGNTEKLAMTIAELTGGELFDITPVTPYPDSYEEMLTVAQEELDTEARPKIASTVENWDDYDVIFIGYPIWHGKMPRIVCTFLESYDFEGKTVIPFNTHEGSGESGTTAEIRELLPDVTVLDGKAVEGNVAQAMEDSTREDIQTWLTDLGYAK